MFRYGQLHFVVCLGYNYVIKYSVIIMNNFGNFGRFYIDIWPELSYWEPQSLSDLRFCEENEKFENFQVSNTLAQFYRLNGQIGSCLLI